jgi:hypothetical protein
MKVLKNSPEIKMIEITFSKAGITQKAEFFFEEGNLVTRKILVSYEAPLIIPETVVSIMDLAKFIGAYSYTGRCVISRINRKSVLFEHRFDKTSAEIARAKIDEFEDKIAEEFFLSDIVPILKKKKWFFCPTIMTGQPTIVYNDENGGPDNVSRHDRMLKRLNVMCQVFKQDKEFSLDYFVGRYIDTNLLKSLDLYKEI